MIAGIYMEGDILTKYLGSGKRMTISALHYYLHGKKYIVEEGFKTDFATIPRLLKPLLNNKDAGVVEGAIWHDKAYREKGQLFDYLAGEYVGLTRRECDKLFYEIMRDNGLGRIKASIGYAGVRVGGWIYWNKSKKVDRYADEKS